MDSDHAYNDPTLMPKEWMLAVMHDPHMALATWIDIAVQPLKLWPEPHHYVPPAIIIRIEGLGTDVPEVSVQADDHGSAGHGSRQVGHA